MKFHERKMSSSAWWSISGRLFGEHVDMDDWRDLTVEQYALLGVLVHPRTLTNRYAKVFDYCSKLQKFKALSMLKERKVIPELGALSPEEGAKIIHDVNREYDVMLNALKNGISYEESFSRMFPYVSPFPSELIWVKKRINGIPSATSYSYEDFLLLLLADNQEVRDYRAKFSREMKMYSFYLREVQDQQNSP